MLTSVNLSQIDLNLLLVLHAVLQRESVVGAAADLHVTPSAVSNALARLRVLLNDPLLVRRGRGLVATPRALSLAPVLATALAGLERVVGHPEQFEPHTSTRQLTIAMADGDQLATLPAVARDFMRELPRARLRVVSIDVLVASGGLAGPAVDLALGPPVRDADHHWQLLYEEDPVAVVRRDHPRVPQKRRELSRALFNSLRHVDTHLVLGRPGEGHRGAEEVFAKHGLIRDVAVVVPTFAAAAMVAASTDLVAALPRRVSELFCQLLPVRLLEMPAGAPQFPLGMLWHERTNHDQGARYFRELVAKAVPAHAKRSAKIASPRPA